MYIINIYSMLVLTVDRSWEVKFASIYIFRQFLISYAFYGQIHLLYRIYYFDTYVVLHFLQLFLRFYICFESTWNNVLDILN